MVYYCPTRSRMHQTLAATVAKLQAQPAYVARFAKAFGAGVLTEDNILKALAQFVRTLVSGNSRYNCYRRGDRSVLSADEVRGLQLFIAHPSGTAIGRGSNCADYHAGDLQINHLFVNNGLDLTFIDLGAPCPPACPPTRVSFASRRCVTLPHGPLARRPLRHPGRRAGPLQRAHRAWQPQPRPQHPLTAPTAPSASASP